MKNLFCLILIAVSMLVKAQVAINTDASAPDNSAILDVKSTEKGFLPPRMTTVQRNTISSPQEGLVIYNTNEKALNLYNGTEWSSMKPVFPCGLSISINHQVSGGVAPVNKTVTYGTVTNIPGELTKCWITSNLGADHQAAAANDATEASAGWYWQFNRKQGYKHASNRTPNTVWITSISESSNWITANDPCSLELGTGWRIPTYTEWYNVDNTGGWTNWNDPFGSALKLHVAGYLHSFDGSLYGRGSGGYYWSSAQSGASDGWCLAFTSSYNYMVNYDKAFGFSVRCIRDF